MPCPFAALMIILPWPLVRRCMATIQNQRVTWILCGKKNVTAVISKYWYLLVAGTQWTLVPLLGLLDQNILLGTLCGARVSATLLTRELTDQYPYQRMATSLPSLLTLGSWWVYYATTTTNTNNHATSSSNSNSNSNHNNSLISSLAATMITVQLKLVAASVVLDAKEMLWHLLGYPYPCYIRQAVQDKKLTVQAPKPPKLLPIDHQHPTDNDSSNHHQRRTSMVRRQQQSQRQRQQLQLHHPVTWWNRIVGP